MTTQLILKQLTLGYGEQLLLDKVDLVIEQGQRIGIMGRNGAGKSTLMKLIAGIVTADSGERILQNECRVAYLQQEVPQLDASDQTIFDVVAEGGGEVGQKLQALHHLNADLAHSPDDDALMKRYTQLQDEIEHLNGWTLEQRIDTQLSRFNLNGEQLFSDLSGGLKRRVLLAQAQINDPNLLLLDEPTNHLDIESIDFLEAFLRSFSGTTMIISHDRRFLAATTDRIIELDRGKLHTYAAGFSRYTALREARLEEEMRHQALFDKKLAEEEAWIRQGIKARRTRNQGRVRALEALREEKREQLAPQSNVRLKTNVADPSGKQVIVTKQMSFRYCENGGNGGNGGNGDNNSEKDNTGPTESEYVVKDLTTLINRGDKVAIIGPNGVGKTTLLKLLLSQLQPTEGTVKTGTNLEIAYFDQLRDTLDLDRSLRDNVGGGSSQVTINGQVKHVVGYLQDFLFSPNKIHAPVSVLSGGERNRLLLAKLFTQPANLLVMDEPTNDLDIETLELLEALLVDYTGTLLLVSHDREFIDRVATSSLVFEGNAIVNAYVGGYSDWLRQRPSTKVSAKTGEVENEGKEEKGEKGREQKGASKISGSGSNSGNTSSNTSNNTTGTGQKSKKLSYKEQRELEQLPAEIERVEAALDAVQAKLADPNFYQSTPQEEISEATKQLESLEGELEHLYERWELLDQ